VTSAEHGVYPNSRKNLLEYIIYYSRQVLTHLLTYDHVQNPD